MVLASYSPPHICCAICTQRVAVAEVVGVLAKPPMEKESKNEYFIPTDVHSPFEG